LVLTNCQVGLIGAITLAFVNHHLYLLPNHSLFFSNFLPFFLPSLLFLPGGSECKLFRTTAFTDGGVAYDEEINVGVRWLCDRVADDKEPLDARIASDAAANKAAQAARMKEQVAAVEADKAATAAQQAKA
jgi:hypothetical protein